MKNTNRVKAAMLLGALLAAAVLAGCETVKGAGKDIQYAGDKSQEALDNVGKK